MLTFPMRYSQDGSGIFLSYTLTAHRACWGIMESTSKLWCQHSPSIEDSAISETLGERSPRAFSISSGKREVLEASKGTQGRAAGILMQLMKDLPR